MRKGSNHTDATKAKMSATRSGRVLSEEHRTAISQSLIGLAKSPESNSKRAEAMRAYWAAKRGSN